LDGAADTLSPLESSELPIGFVRSPDLPWGIFVARYAQALLAATKQQVFKNSFQC
jgi:hypothetical protein